VKSKATVAKSKGGVASGKAITKEAYTKKTPIEHVLLRPDLYVGPTELVLNKMWVPECAGTVREREVSYSPALLKLFDEILVNALDCHTRGTGVTRIDVMCGEDGSITVWNDGRGLPIRKHTTEDLWIPELVFGHLLTGSNFDDTQERFTGGRMGYGAKLANIFSTEFEVVTCDPDKGLMYTQQWKHNMSICSEPEITEVPKGSSSFTSVRFVPDTQRFGGEGMDDVARALCHRRALDAAVWCGNKVTVTFNGEQLENTNLNDFAQMFGMVPMAVSENKTWRVAVGASPSGTASQVSYVNGISTPKGGTHVAAVADQIASHVADHINKHHSKTLGGTAMTNAIVKNQLELFVLANIDKPSFDAQMKEQLTSRASEFGTKPKLPATFLAQLTQADSPIVAAALNVVLSKQRRELVRKSKTASPTRKRRRLAIDKLDDANLAGTKHGANQCTLILTEGDSAKSLAVAGLAEVGRDTYGVFPLKGKLLNARTASHRQLTDNKELNHLKTILGLSHSMTYEDKSELETLRYGKILLMTDQDADGSHIKGLMINMLHHFWPALLKHDGFLHEFVTPLVKVWPRKQRKTTEPTTFYTSAEFEIWKASVSSPADFHKQFISKYYKGLGTSTAAEAREYFAQLDKHKIQFEWDDGCESLIDLAFNKDRAEDRKTWLLEVNNSTFVDHTADVLTYSDFVNKELSLYSTDSNRRAIPCLMDGLKPAQRKVLWSLMQRPLGQEIKVAQLSGYVSEKSAYHHGEASLQGTITSMAQSFVGSNNNLPLLEPVGQFGTRLTGGKDAASPRYIFTKTSPLVPALFSTDDDAVLTYNDDDGQQIEPAMFAPVIPLVLVNGCAGIGTGWSTTVPPHHPLEVLHNVRRAILREPLYPMSPWALGFKGNMVLAESGTYITQGAYEIENDDCVRITELPLYRWTEEYKKFLDNNSHVSDFREHHTERSIDFEIKFHSADDLEELQQKPGGLMRALKLESNVKVGNMHVFDEHGVLRKFDDSGAILEHFVDVRMGLYDDRYAHLLAEKQEQLTKITDHVQLADLVLEGKVNVMNTSRENLHAQIEACNLESSVNTSDAADALLRMSLRQFTQEEVQRQQAKRDKVLEQLGSLQGSSAKELWLKDLDHAEDVITQTLDL